MTALALSLLLTIGAATALSADIVSQLPRDANQIWFDSQFAYPLHPRINITGSGTLRLGRGLDHFVYERAGAAVSFKALRFLTIAPSCYYVASQPLPGQDTREQRLAVDGILSWRLHGFDLSDRNRFERRQMPLNTYFRYMNRLMIQHPVRLRTMSINAYLSDEVYYDGLLATWSRNRFSAGIGKRINPYILMEFYYLRQNDHYSKPGDINVFGINFKMQAIHKHS